MKHLKPRELAPNQASRPSSLQFLLSVSECERYAQEGRTGRCRIPVIERMFWPFRGVARNAYRRLRALSAEQRPAPIRRWLCSRLLSLACIADHPFGRQHPCRVPRTFNLLCETRAGENQGSQLRRRARAGENWRPVFEPEVVRRELTIIKDDLHCNAVRICGRDVSRLEKAAEFALELGLDAWLSPELWNKGPEPTLRYAVDAARMAEDLCRRWPGKVVLCIGSELTLFMRGILPGRSVLTRVREMRKNPSRAAGAPALSDYLTRATEKVRGVFSGPVTYASLVWESVDWKETLKYH